jgi:hypothetical protein
MTSSRAAALLGAFGVLGVPAGVVSAQVLSGVTLVRGLYYGVPIALVLGAAALLVSRRARFAAQRSVFADRAGPVRLAWRLGWLALYIGITAGISVAVYWVLRARH